MSNHDKEGAATKPAGDSSRDPLSHPDDSGAYVGSRPARQGETIPGGITDDDERIAAHSTRRDAVVDDTAERPDDGEAGQ